MKKEYRTPDLSIQEFVKTDIITASGEGNTTGNKDNALKSVAGKNFVTTVQWDF